MSKQTFFWNCRSGFQEDLKPAIIDQLLENIESLKKKRLPGQTDKNIREVVSHTGH